MKILRSRTTTINQDFNTFRIVLWGFTIFKWRVNIPRRKRHLNW